MELPLTQLPRAPRAQTVATAADLHPCQVVEADAALEGVHHAGLADDPCNVPATRE